MAVVETWGTAGPCQCKACQEARAEQARDCASAEYQAREETARAREAELAAAVRDYPPGRSVNAPPLQLEVKEPWQRASPFALQLSAAALDAHLAPLVARVAALEARAAAPVEGAGVVYRYAAPHEPADALLQCVSGVVGLVLVR